MGPKGSLSLEYIATGCCLHAQASLRLGLLLMGREHPGTDVCRQN